MMLHAVPQMQTTVRNHDTPDLSLILWEDAELNYLLSCLYPHLMMQNQLTFSPPLEALQHHTSPIHLKLFATIPIQPVPPEAFSRHAPIGTGRPTSRVLLAESQPNCLSPAAAHESLAITLLKDFNAVNDIVAKFDIFSALFICSKEKMASLKRGMEGMAKVRDIERLARRLQLCSVDEECDFEARLEVYLLQVGIGELDNWIQMLDVGLRMEKRDREEFAGIYGDAGDFLRRAFQHKWG